MSAGTKRITVNFDPELYRALLLNDSRSSLSDLVNEAVEISLAEDAEDLESFKQRACESNLSFKDVVKDLKRRRKI